jgi:putative transposase
VSVSAYYERACGRRSARALEDERLLCRIRELHAANYYAYGYRRVWLTLRRAGEQVGRGRVQRLMQRQAIEGAKRRGKPWRTSKPDPQAARRPDLVQRDFGVDAPNRLWVADISYLRCWEGLVFFAFVLDAYSRIPGSFCPSSLRFCLSRSKPRVARSRSLSAACASSESGSCSIVAFIEALDSSWARMR